MARRLGRPVRWVSDRREDLLATTQAWDEVIDAELALDRDGGSSGFARTCWSTSARIRCSPGRPPSSRSR
jgi:CO/xanthine dehydrogenase Mo-binding subunit